MTDLLSDALSSAVTKYSGPSKGSPNGADDHFGRTPSIDSEKFAILRERIATTDRCAAFIGQNLVWGGRSVNLNASNLAWWLVERAASTSPSQAIHDLAAFGSRYSVPGSVALAIAGPDVKDPATLSNRVSLERTADAPPSMSAQTAQAISNGLVLGTRPTCVLVAQHTTPCPLGFESKADASSQRAELKAIRQALNDTRLGLLLASHGGAIVHSYWAAPDEDIPCSNRLAQHGQGLPADQPDTTVISKEGIADIERYLKLEDKPQRRVKTVLQYLNEAIVTPQITTRAVSLGTALEVMFGQPDNRSELRFRTSVAAARYLGTTPDTRREIFDTCKSIYDVRSEAVHTGTIKGHPKEVEDRLRHGQYLLLRVLKEFVREPIDDWTAVILG